MQVTCAAASMPSARMRVTSSTGASRGLAPVRVTETNPGPSGLSASIVRMRAASPSGVFGGKNSNEMQGPPRARMSVIFMGRREDDGGSRELVRAFLLERLHLLVLTVVVAGGHGHEQPFHAAVPLPPQDLQPLVELPEVLVHPRPRVDRIQEEIVQAGDREADRRESQLIRERVPLGERQSAQRLVARDERLEALDLVALADRVEVGEHAADVLDLRRREARGRHGVPVDVAVEREALAVHLAVVPPLAVGDRLRAGKAVLAQEEEQVELTLHLELALHLVDAQQMLSARGLEQIGGVDGARRDSTRRDELRETVVLDNFGELARSELGVNGHLRPPP